ncbi:MAG: TldD/PmbA family protein [Myxococcota bacterium]
MSLRLSGFQAHQRQLLAWKPPIPGFYAILRLQSRLTRIVNLSNHEPYGVESRWDEGMGLQVFASGGRTVFVSADSLELEQLENLMKQSLKLLEAHPIVPGALEADFSSVEKLVADRFMEGENAASLSLQALLDMLGVLHRELFELSSHVTRGMNSSFSAIDDEWHIFRSDGTDVHFNTWRTSLSHRVTVSQEGTSTAVRESESGADASILWDPNHRAAFKDRVRRKIELGLGILKGTPLKAGHYNIILDAGMAKGLAHEAFGHACESDSVLDGSALTRNHRYLVGERVAPPGVYIVDFPMPRDWADQPFSANGFVRQAVEIVKDGVLSNALSDLFSGPAVGVAVTGAERVERYDCVPMPRMTNIRLELAQAIPWDREFGRVEPQELYQFLQGQSLVNPQETWLYLEGYRGGQVNTLTGDYVFNCTAIHKFQDGVVTTHPPAIFSGQILKTLAAVKAAVGPLELECQGMCGKDGQRVPSSGGGHLFTLFNATEGIAIGGH